MTIVHKRILYLCFFGLFFALAPIVLMYAQGYKFDINRKKMIKTGVMFLETKPSKAQVYLNNELYKEKTTARIQRLLPGEYDVKLTKKGYKPWQKKLVIYPNSTTYAQYVRLFKESPQVKQLTTGQIIYTKYSPNENLVALIVSREGVFYLDIYNFITQQIMDSILVANENYFVADIKWSTNSNKLFIELGDNIANENIEKNNKKTFLLYDSNKRGQVENLNFEIKQDIEKLDFCEFNDSLFYFYIEDKKGNGEFWKYNQILKAKNNLLNVKLVDIYLYGNNIYYVNADNEINEVYYFSLANPDKQFLLTNLPSADDYKIIDIHDNLITIHSEDKNKLYLIKLNGANELEKMNIITNTKGIQWHNNKHVIAWWNDYELWTWEVEKADAEKKLLTRVSSVIDDVFWYPVETHLAYTTYNKIRIIELISHSGVRETTDIFTTQEVNNPVVTNKGDRVYFNGKVGKNEGFFELQIQ